MITHKVNNTHLLTLMLIYINTVCVCVCVCVYTSPKQPKIIIMIALCMFIQQILEKKYLVVKYLIKKQRKKCNQLMFRSLFTIVSLFF